MKILEKIKSWFDLKTFLRIIFGILFITAIVLIAYFVMKETGFLEKINSIEKIKELLNKYKTVSIIIYWCIQFLQVTFIPIPAAITIVAGAQIFGPWWTFFISLAAMIPASILAFFLGRWLGKPFVGWMIGKETMNKYLTKTHGRERTVFFTMFLLPFFPDDALCLVAGITPMTLKYFLMTQIITRPISIVCTIFLMSGTIIPYNTWWGITLYVLAFIGVIIAIILSYKYSEKIEGFVSKCVDKVLKFLHIRH